MTPLPPLQNSGACDFALSSPAAAGAFSTELPCKGGGGWGRSRAARWWRAGGSGRRGNGTTVSRALRVTQESLSRLLSSCGLVQSVELQEKPDLAESPKESRSKFFHPKPVPGFQVAYVVFQKPSGVSAALALKGPLLVSTESHPVKSGIHKWISDYADSMPDPEALRVEVDTFLEAYDQKIAEEEAEAKEEDGVCDEEGWVKVTRRGRRPVLPRTEAASLRVLERERRKRARKELLNFYAWQHRESKMEHLAQLRKKFEEDKQRIELLRAQRKFRPY
ncbi:ribosomal RNA-processing protein 7 homolog A-like [Macaca thibetana thibetana]|uniref:ribosomal RNA-processing protein 7 homolog A-like n=1 Tax=Macaca thibetana thibetana TaxID=257877 RepID=UPI0021BC9AD5|nr:ribosomal RNA-processing protein 7 homolog A-like [Macaca thibetana thibetana]